MKPELQAVDSLESPIIPAPKARPENEQPGNSQSRESVGYTSPAERCESCRHFEDEDQKCGKFGFEAEEGGHCRAGWEPGEGEDYEVEDGEDEGDDLDDAIESLEE